MKLIILALSTLVLMSSVGCSHFHKVAGPLDNDDFPGGIVVAIGKKEVVAGDKLDVLEPVCKKVYRGRAGYMNECKRKKTGEAIVLKVTSDDSAIIRPEEGLVMSKDAIVEKKEPLSH